MTIPLMAWYPPSAVLPETPVVLDLAIGLWLGGALLASLVPLLWSVARSRDLGVACRGGRVGSGCGRSAAGTPSRGVRDGCAPPKAFALATGFLARRGRCVASGSRESPGRKRTGAG
jgi:hypothetical protein